MSSPHLSPTVIRLLNAALLKAFFEELGNSFVEDQRGSDPAHWAADLDGLVAEVYPSMTADEMFKAARLGLEIEGVADTVKTLRVSRIAIADDVKESR